MAILIVSNRNVNRGRTDETLFGDEFNKKGPNELRLATAQYERGRWRVDLVPEAGMTVANPPSRRVFDRFRDNLMKNKLNCVFFIHGFNQTFKKNLKKCKEIQDTYDVDVVAFSWPSNPGGLKLDEYKKAQAAARNSVMALDRTFEKMGDYIGANLPLDCGISFNLLIHSLGNYLFENFIRAPVFSGETRLFDNIILHQADVDNPRHAVWINTLRYARRIYITINENDYVLKWSDIVNPDRLGNTARNLNAIRPAYFDFTKADKVDRAHRIFWKSRRNPNVKEFFKLVFHGQQGETGPGLNFNSDKNAFEVQ